MVNWIVFHQLAHRSCRRRSYWWTNHWFRSFDVYGTDVPNSALLHYWKTFNSSCSYLSQGASHLREVFYRMGLSDKDIVALSGGHTLCISLHIQWCSELLKGDSEGLLKLPTDKVLVEDPEFRQYVELYAKVHNYSVTFFHSCSNSSWNLICRMKKLSLGTTRSHTRNSQS